MAVQEFTLPDVGEGLTEAEIVTWKVQVGDTVRVNDVVVEIETAKSLVELPTPWAGTVTALLAEEGQTVPVGSPIIAVEDGAPSVDLSDPAAGGEEHQTLVGYGPRSGSAMRRARRGPATAATMAGSATQMQVQGSFALGQADTSEVVPADEEPVPAVPARASTAGGGSAAGGSVAPGSVADGSVAGGRVLAPPSVRGLAKELGVDLRTVTGSGPGGVVTAADLRGALTRPDGAGPLTRREPATGVQRAMARAMVRSAATIPQVTEWVTVDVTRSMKLVRRLRADPELTGVRLSPLVVVAKAVCLAVRRTPEVNAHWEEETQEVVHPGVVNLGIAAATPRGLVVPVVPGADGLTLPELARAVDERARTAREGRTSPAEMSGGTFTITNVGVLGVDAGTPLVNPGESAILAVGAVRAQPWVHRGKVRVREVTTLALSFDHRFIDGATGSRFLTDVAALLHDPALALRY